MGKCQDLSPDIEMLNLEDKVIFRLSQILGIHTDLEMFYFLCDGVGNIEFIFEIWTSTFNKDIWTLKKSLIKIIEKYANVRTSVEIKMHLDSLDLDYGDILEDLDFVFRKYRDRIRVNRMY